MILSSFKKKLKENSKFLKKTPSQNKTNFKSIITLKDLMEKQNPKKKNKTFDSMSFLKNQMVVMRFR